MEASSSLGEAPSLALLAGDGEDCLQAITTNKEPAGARRPIKARETRWAASVAGWLARAGVKPNTISVYSAVFAGIAGSCLALTPGVSAVWGALLFVGAALGIQLRLLCNLFDGMVAVEGGFRTKSGEIFNELPDRFADAFVLVGCAYAVPMISCGLMMGWLAALLAVITAYIRTLGAAAGAGQCFLGPMAKQHRMAIVTAASLGSSVAVFWRAEQWILFIALGILVAGMLITIPRRTRWIVRTLEAK